MDCDAEQLSYSLNAYNRAGPVGYIETKPSIVLFSSFPPLSYASPLTLLSWARRDAIG